MSKRPRNLKGAAAEHTFCLVTQQNDHEEVGSKQSPTGSGQRREAVLREWTELGLGRQRSKRGNQTLGTRQTYWNHPVQAIEGQDDSIYHSLVDLSVQKSEATTGTDRLAQGRAN